MVATASAAKALAELVSRSGSAALRENCKTESRQKIPELREAIGDLSKGVQPHPFVQYF
jgi:hypothetical protein